MQAIVAIVILCLLAILAIMRGWGIVVAGFVLGAILGGSVGFFVGPALGPGPETGADHDNYYVEQENWKAVPQQVGYARYDTPGELEVLAELYRHHASPK